MPIATRDDAYRFLTSKTKNDRLVKHMLAVEAVVRALAKKLGGDPDRWGLAGLLHDTDYAMNTTSVADGDLRGASAMPHTLESVFRGVVDDELLRVMQSHDPEHTGVKPETKWERALTIADPVTGLIVAAALVQPDKKLASVDLDSLKRKFKDKAFAKGASREQIRRCEELGLSLEEFLDLSLKAMQEIAPQLGL